MRAVVLVLLVGCASAQRAGLTIGYAASSALIVCDYSQTLWASDAGRWDRNVGGVTYREMNPVIGSTPSIARMNAIASADLVVDMLVAISPTPRWLRAVWFGAITAVEAYLVVDHQAELGWCGR